MIGSDTESHASGFSGAVPAAGSARAQPRQALRQPNPQLRARKAPRRADTEPGPKKAPKPPKKAPGGGSGPFFGSGRARRARRSAQNSRSAYPGDCWTERASQPPATRAGPKPGTPADQDRTPVGGNAAGGRRREAPRPANAAAFNSPGPAARRSAPLLPAPARRGSAAPAIPPRLPYTKRDANPQLNAYLTEPLFERPSYRGGGSNRPALTARKPGPRTPATLRAQTQTETGQAAAGARHAAEPGTPRLRSNPRAHAPGKNTARRMRRQRFPGPGILPSAKPGRAPHNRAPDNPRTRPPCCPAPLTRAGGWAPGSTPAPRMIGEHR